MLSPNLNYMPVGGSTQVETIDVGRAAGLPTVTGSAS
jgi:hypothetical protein